jgi:prepilin-type N-terminal cleavage/methylation domain-containing protein
MLSERKGFSLTEVLVALLLGGVAIAGMTRFFIAQFHQYYLITNNNGLNYDLRTMAKYLERDIRSSIEFNVSGTTSLNVLLAGTWADGSGFTYSIDGRTKNKYTVQSLIRTPCTFSSKDESILLGSGLVVAEDCCVISGKDLFIPFLRPIPTSSDPNPLAGTRMGVFVLAKLQRGAGNRSATTYCRLFFHSRNPQFK